ncbi:MAG: 6-bladed beta-propeller, partial [Prolixibacteraceae bacterium]|nr:6-bladed beta-propeller [Prolixibacteraceae bacterium]
MPHNFRRVNKYGKIGREPGEYIYFLKFAVDETSGSVYVMDHKMDDIEVYNSKGIHIRNIKLPKDDYGFGLSDIESQNSMLFFAQYINMGHGIYNWLITDTLGDIKQIKKNPYSAFKGRRGSSGGVFKHKKYIGYWDSCKDTIFKISPDLSYDIIGIFSPGEHRFPKNSAAYNSLETYRRNRDKYCMSYMFFETNNFFVYKYFLNGLHLALIDKKSGLTKSINLGNNKNGIINNIDGGIAFIPEIYFANIKHEYMVSAIHPFVIKAHVASEEFKNSTTKYPEKKKEL